MKKKNDVLASLSRVMRPLMIPLLALLILAHPDASAQTGNSTLVGTVMDMSGAVVPGAKVTVLNQATGVVKTVDSSAIGGYEFPFLADGVYTISVEFTGFEKAEVRNVELDVRNVGRIDFSIKPAKVAQAVTVTDAAPLLTTDSANVGSLFKVDDAQELPIGRDFASLQLLTPGVTRGYDAGGSWGVQISPGFVSGGGDLNSTDFSIDGADNNRSFTMHNAYSPSMDMIAEVKIDTGGLSAEYGRGSGAVDISLKSGTNRFHGTLFDYLQNNALNARYFLATAKPDPLHVNEYGASIGGPIIKNKLFFMFAWTATKNNSSSTQETLMPTADEWAGHLSVPVVDPLTGLPFPGTDGYTIPTDRISPFATAIQGCCSAPANSDGLWVGPIKNITDRSNFDFKVDYILRPADSLAVSWGHQSITYLLGQFPTLSANNDAFRGNRLSGHWTHTFSPRFFNSLVVAGHKDWTDGDQQAAGSDFISKVGLQLPTYIPGRPNVLIPSLGRFGGWFGPLASTDATYQLTEGANLIRGKHALSFGGEYRRMHQNPQFDYYTRGIFGFYGGFSGSDFGDFLLGTPSLVYYAPPVGKVNTSYYQISGYFQDNWRVTPSLTLNLGLRYEFTSWPIEKHNVLASIIPETGQVALASDASGNITSRIDPVAYASAKPGTFVSSASAGLPRRSLIYPDKRDWAPRIGFAYQPSFLRSLTVRGSYGISYNADPQLGFTMSYMFTVPPFTATRSFNNSDPTLSVLDPLRDYESPTPPDRIPGDYFDPHMRQAYYQNWGLNVQKALPGRMVFDVGYQGSRGVHITMLRYNYNQSLTLPDTSDRFPGFTTIAGFTSDGNSRYDGLQAKLRKDISHGLSFTAMYTWSNAMDDGSAEDQGQFYIHDPKLDWGKSVFAHRHVFSTEFIYQLPFGKGKAWGNNINPVLDGVLGGWQLSSVLYAASGDFLSVTSETALASVNTQVWPRADRVASPSLSNRSTAEWFNTSAFAAPPPGRGGLSARGAVEGPGSFTPDVAISKNFGVWKEGWRFQFRAEMYNAINHVNWGDPGTLLEGSDFGQIHTFGNPRTMQLGLKFAF
jgi:outer membrane receptor protein involved in Fe transport